MLDEMPVRFTEVIDADVPSIEKATQAFLDTQAL